MNETEFGKGIRFGSEVTVYTKFRISSNCPYIGTDGFPYCTNTLGEAISIKDKILDLAKM